MKKGKFLVLGLVGLIIAPSVAYGISNLTQLVDFFTNFITNSVVGLLYALAIVYFFLGVMKFIKGADDVKAREEGRQFMIWGIIGLFVMVSFQGIVMVLKNTFQLPTSNTPTTNSKVINSNYTYYGQ